MSPYSVGGDGKLKNQLIDYIKENKLSQYITLVNKVPYSEVPSYISVMDIAVMPNSNFSGSPIKIFEYMAMKKPCVAMATPAIKEIIKNKFNGYLVNNTKELEEAIYKLVNNKKLRKKFGENARRTILKKRYTWDNNAKRIVEMYNSLNNDIL